MEGFERAHLTGQRRIIGVFLDRKAAHVRRVALFHMQRLCDRIRHDRIGKDLAVRHAHIRPQPAHACRDVLHAVHPLDLLHQRLIEHLRIEAQQKLSREHGVQCHAQARPRLHDGLPHGGRGLVRRLDAEHGVLQEHDGVSHVHVENIRLPRHRYKAQLPQRFGKRRLAGPAAAERIRMSPFQTSGQKLVQKHPQILALRFAFFGLHTADQQDPARCMLADVAARLQRAERVIEVIQQDRMADGPAKHPLRPGKQRDHASAGPLLHADARLGLHGGRRLRLVSEIQLLPAQHVLQLRRADIQAAFIDVGLHDRRDQHRDIQILIDRRADARGADRLIKRRQGQKQQLAADDCRKLLRICAAIPAEDHVVVLRRRAGLPALVGRRMLDDVAAGDQI